MGRKDERSKGTDNNTTNVSERRVSKAWLEKHSDKKGGNLVREVEKLNDQREAGRKDRN